MIAIKKHIPNFITLCNLFCGCVGIAFAFENRLDMAFYMICLAALFDFLDGFAARMLKVQSAIGKELDSLADMVTFGLLPGVLLFQMFYLAAIPMDAQFCHAPRPWWSYIAFMVPLFSALRLAKFNIDTRQLDQFIGLPTPANALLIGSIAWITSTPDAWNTWILDVRFLFPFTVAASLILVAEMPLLALKFKSFRWSGNVYKYSLLIFSAVGLLLFQIKFVPCIILAYLVLSWLSPKNRHHQSDGV